MAEADYQTRFVRRNPAEASCLGPLSTKVDGDPVQRWPLPHRRNKLMQHSSARNQHLLPFPQIAMISGFFR